jgi:hypothetical protein
VRLERGTLSLVSTIEELLERKSSGCGLENRDYDYAAPLHPQKLALISPTSGGRSVDIVRPRTTATELLLFTVGHACRRKLREDMPVYMCVDFPPTYGFRKYVQDGIQELSK